MTEQQTSAPFLGRDAELNELLGALAEAEHGRGRLFLIGGEPGIGKSRLADELAARARERGQAVLWGRGWEDAGAPPYWPWVQVFRSYVRNTDRDLLLRQMGAGATDIAQMLPELRDHFPGLEAPASTNSDAARFQLFDSATDLLRNAAAERSLLVILDDLQAADTPSIRYLRFLASQLGEMRMLVIGTYRDVELTPDHPLTEAIGELAREPITRTITLSGLGRGALRRFLGAAVGAEPEAHVVDALLRGTGGNPLYMEEAVRLLSAEGTLDDLVSGPSHRVAVPAGIRSVIGRRLARLTDEARRVLAIGAVIGPEFELDLLRATTDLASVDVVDALDEASAAGIVVAAGGSVGRYRFSHDLVRETLYHELAPGQRMRLHRQVAEALEQLHGSAPEAHLAELAYHFYEAERDRTPTDRSIAYARRAGEEAARSLAFEEAARLYAMTLAAMERGGVADPRIRLELLLGLGDARTRGGDLKGARAALLEAAEIAKAIGAPPELARAALAIGGRMPWARPGHETMLIPLLQDALVYLGGENDRLRIRLLARLACAWRSSPDKAQQSEALSRQAVELARTLDDPATLSYALAAQFWATWRPDNPENRLALAGEMMGIAETLADGERRIDAHFMLWLSHTELTDMATAHRESDEVRRLVVDLRQPAHRWLGIAPRALLALMEGEFVEAEGLIEQEIEEHAGLTVAGDNISAGRFHRFLLRREQGRLAEYEPVVRASIEDFPWYPLHRSAMACLLADLGRTAEGLAVMHELARDGFAMLYPDNEWLLGACLAADACARLTDAADAEVLYAQLAPYAGRHAIGHAEGSIGAVDRYLGLLAAALDRIDDAARHLDEAIAINERMGARPWTAHAQHDLAVVLRRRHAADDVARADALDRTALATATELGMTALVAAIGPDEPSATSSTGAVFRREGEVWTLRFDGTEVRMRDAKGLGYVARLLDRPGQEIHALDLATPSAARTPAGVLAELSPRTDSDAGAMLDGDAKAAYRSRIDELRADLAEAEEWNDGERASRARTELEFLESEIAAAVGLGGRDRHAASATERARISVTRAIRGTLDRIGVQSPSLGRHLEATIRTGTYCSYTPDPRVRIGWEL